jgi:hypothetical protein
MKDIWRAMNRRVTFAILIVLLWGFGMACDDRPTPFTPPSDDLFPPSPENVRARVGDGQIELRWDIEDSAKVEQYRIYRRLENEERPLLIDSVQVRSYVDSNLANGKTYFYQITSVNPEGFEGKPSEEVSAVPNIYDMLIEDGKEFTNRVNVFLKFTAPEGTALMKISNDSSFVDAAWETFSAQRSWTLPNGDGEKTVYAKFRDANDHETAEPIRGRIILDTRAFIEKVTEDTEGKVKKPGDIIHFKVVAGEPDGKATVDIGTAERGIKLYDDGTNGDETAEDGVYERDYEVPPALQVADARIVGHFTDRAGNTAPTATAVGLVTVQLPPSPVTLARPSAIDSVTLRLTWSRSTEDDFASYRLYRSESSPVDTSNAPIAIINDDPGTTQYDDNDVRENVTYFYRIFVFDEAGLSAGSNEVQGRISR